MNTRSRRGPKGAKGNREEHVLNEKIRHPQVRVVDFGEQSGVYSTKDALGLAKAEGVDLIEINAKADPPICKIMEYSKFKYEQKKRQKANKDNSKSKPIKEIKFGPNTGDHDFEFKLKNAKGFLEKGHKVKAYVQFRGREMAFQAKGELMLLRFAEALENEGKVLDYYQLMFGIRERNFLG